LSASIVDYLLILQITGSLGHTASPDSQHHPQKFLGEQKFVRLDPIMGHKKPSAAPLIGRMEMGACSRLHDLAEKGVRVVQHHSPHRTAGAEFLL